MAEKSYTSDTRCGIMKLDERAIAAIEAIIQRGNNAEIRRKGKGYVVLEDEKTIKYHAPVE